MSNAIYEGVLTGTITNGVAEVAIQRVSDHACRCDECEALDVEDLPLLAISKRYLEKEIDLKQFRLEHVKASFFPNSIAASLHRNFDKGACGLDAAIEGCLFECEMSVDENGIHGDRSGFREKDFRMQLRAMIHGYELRMRTVHFWKKQGVITQ